MKVYLQKRKVQSNPVASFLSEPVRELLTGMLAPEPTNRLTLSCAESDKKSIFLNAWLGDSVGSAHQDANSQ